MFLSKTKHSWQFYTDSDEDTEFYCVAQLNSGCFLPRGKMLGGTSGINNMQYVRGNRADFDGWLKFGNDGWDYESILPYFKKSENNLNASFVNYKNGEYHSAKGPSKIDFFAKDGTDSIQNIFLNAAIESGNEQIVDINADESVGYLKVQGFYANGARQSAAKSYLVPSKNRPNLQIIKNAFVEKILIFNKTAFGVRFVYHGKQTRRFIAIANKEVIVSAGPIMSPHLLMLSGIGPKNHLNSFGIPVKSDLAVGDNLIDQPSVYIWFKFKPTMNSPTSIFDSLFQYATFKNGSLASIGVTQLTGFINSVNGSGVPDFQINFFYFTANSTENFRIFLNNQNYNDHIKRILLCENQMHDIGVVIPVQLHEKSRGTIELASASPNVYPIIKPKFFSRVEDMEAILRVVKIQISYLNTTSYRNSGGAFLDLPISNCDRLERGSNDYYRCYIRYFSSSWNNPAGGCKMSNDEDGVVDHELKVRNIHNLRVIDASM